MSIYTLRDFFMWCSILNAGLLTITAIFLLFCNDWVYRIHGRWFPMPRETFNVVIYAFLGLFKMVFIVLNLVPYIVLLIMS